mgnify:CR=1 FL=1
MTGVAGPRVLILRRALILAIALLLAGPAREVEAAAEPPKIRKPRPAPAGVPPMPPLPPAAIDPALAIGGEELEARKVETRLTVKVRLNGRGPYDFIVDSGADTSVVGLRIARDLQLPLATFEGQIRVGPEKAAIAEKRKAERDAARQRRDRHDRDAVVLGLGAVVLVLDHLQEEEAGDQDAEGDQHRDARHRLRDRAVFRTFGI